MTVERLKRPRRYSLANMEVDYSLADTEAHCSLVDIEVEYSLADAEGDCRLSNYSLPPCLSSLLSGPVKSRR